MNKTLLSLGNLVHDSVPVDNNEDNNAIVRTWGSPLQAEKLPNHVDLVHMLDIVDTEKGAEVAGGRGYYLKGAVGPPSPHHSRCPVLPAVGAPLSLAPAVVFPAVIPARQS